MWRVDTQLLAELNPAPQSSISFMVRSFLNDPVFFLELTVNAEEPSTTGALQGPGATEGSLQPLILRG